MAPGRRPGLVADPLHDAAPARDRRRSLPSRPSTRRWRASRRASGGTRRSARSRSSRARWSRASTAARSRSAPTSGARRRASRAVSSASSSTTAVGTAKRRRARARRSTPRSACWRGCSSTSARSASAPEIAAARRRGEEYLLERGLFRRRSTGEVANPAFLKFAFPPRYHYDVLRALDYFRDAGVQPDARIGDALHVVESRRQADGRWLLDRAHDEALAFPFGESVGEPSRWNTLRALRVLRWAQPARHEATSRRAN